MAVTGSRLAKGTLVKVDVLIVGSGPAGLSAAFVLGRCHRKVLVCDEGRQRNLSSHAIHGLLGREGKSPWDFSCPATFAGLCGRSFFLVALLLPPLPFLFECKR
jgi:glycine/D-amino acid oxidase-like deaminating enzyme